jgi:hypothetical protein
MRPIVLELGWSEEGVLHLGDHPVDALSRLLYQPKPLKRVHDAFVP